ncbi:hypothetical protein NKH77_54360 [Streptomyces sp. M19]
MLRGDREDAADLARLAEAGPWDAVVDVCGYVPRTVAASVAALASSASTYLFISSINAYPGWPAVPVDENSPRHEGRSDAGPDDGDYGTLKVGAELAVERGSRARADPPAGPDHRAARAHPAAELVAAARRRGRPDGRARRPDREMQLIDVRDIAVFGLDRIAAEGSGTYLVGGEPANTTWGDFLAACVEASGGGRSRCGWATTC